MNLFGRKPVKNKESREERLKASYDIRKKYGLLDNKKTSNNKKRVSYCNLLCTKLRCKLCCCKKFTSYGHV